MDETALFSCLPIPDKGLLAHQMSGVKGNKSCITVALCANMDTDGLDKRSPLKFIGRARRPRVFGKEDERELGYDCWLNTKTWMPGSIWQG
jgi:hypothetical protein